MDQAKKLSDPLSCACAGESAVRQELETLFDLLRPEAKMDTEELKKLKEVVFGPTGFWVTEVRSIENLQGGQLVRGNMRAGRDTVFEDVCKRMQDAFGEL